MYGTDADIRITSSPEQAWQLLQDIADNEDLREALSKRETVADALRAYGIDLSDDAVPPEPTVPSVEEARAGLEELREQKQVGAVEPHVGFRPPWCRRDPPPHSATFGYVFGVIGHRAEPPP